jgi:hypothetical protein
VKSATNKTLNSLNDPRPLPKPRPRLLKPLIRHQ